MFKPGEQIVFIDNKKFNNLDNCVLSHIHLNNTYVVWNTDETDNTIMLIDYPSMWFKSFRFVTVKEYRKQKLKRICSKSEI